MKEQQRLDQHYTQKVPWLQWGPYLAERQWGTVREDYSANGDAWNYFPHDMARSRAYRWGEDGLGGISDDFQNLCFAIALWNGQDPILKERLFGLTGPQGNHGEDVKELYYYLDSTPTHSYLKFLYKYPQAAFPYDELVSVNAARSKREMEYELLDTGVFDQNRYFDVLVEYAKADHDDLCIRITVTNRGPEAAPVWLLPTLWFRNTWDFGLAKEKPTMKKISGLKGYQGVETYHHHLGHYFLYAQSSEEFLFTDNETHREKLFDEESKSIFHKDAFHRAVVEDDGAHLKGKQDGTKCAPVYQTTLQPGESATYRLRLSAHKAKSNPLLGDFEAAFSDRIAEADAFYAQTSPALSDPDLALIRRQALAGMLWTKQFYYLDIPRWLSGDPGQPVPPQVRKQGRNANWLTLNNADIISMPDKWEYPWYAAWDLAFHCVPLAMVDVNFAKNQLILIMREWYMHPNGQIPAYEWNFSDVNPPVHAWAAWEVYQMEKQKTGTGDVDFLKRVFQKLLLNFTWWVNRKDLNDNNVFEGGFLGLDNIGVFDRSSHLPGGGHLDQADGTAWMAAFSLHMLQIALEISCTDRSFEDVATKFFEHFTLIAETLNHLHGGEEGMWDEEAGFYFDKLILPNGESFPVKVRSLVGLSPIFAVLTIPKSLQEMVPDFMVRMNWFRTYREESGIMSLITEREDGDLLLAMVPRERLQRLLKSMLDEEEFLAPGGIRSLSKWHEQHDYTLMVEGENYGLRYEPGESTTRMFGGNSNWRGPVWFPMNYMLIHSLDVYDRFFGDKCITELPAKSGNCVKLSTVADDIARRLLSIFQRDEAGNRPVNAPYEEQYQDPEFRDLILFFEYFHGDNSRGLGASHQTGWTGLVAELIDRIHGKGA